MAASTGLTTRRRSAARSSTGCSCSCCGASSRRSALGLIGGIDSAFNKQAFDKHKNTIVAGFILLAVIWFVGWELLLPA